MGWTGSNLDFLFIFIFIIYYLFISLGGWGARKEARLLI